MTLRNSLSAIALLALISPAAALSACGLGSSADVGDDTLGQGNDTGGATGSSGGSTGSSGGSATGGSAQGGGTASGGSAQGGGSATGGSAQGGGTGIACGKNVCGAGEYCCNASCGMCAPMGAACIQIACGDPPTGVACGANTCAPGQECCNPSCGICVDPGGACTQQFCEPQPTDAGRDCSGIAALCMVGTVWSVEACQCVPVDPACATDADCRLVSDYCTGCDCRALAQGQDLPVCPGPGVACFADPCTVTAFKAACVNGACVAQPQ